MKLKKKILITGIGSDIAQGMCRIIKQKFPSCKIYGSDIGYMHSGKLFADRLTIFPRADRKIEYIKKLNSYIQKNKIDLFIPTSESEILNFDCSFDLKELVNDLLSFKDFPHLIKNLIFRPETYNYPPLC